MTIQLTLPQARCIALTAQRLDRPDDDIQAALEQAGFIRTLGGVDAYLALHARVRNLSRSAVDKAVAKRQAQVLPSARGCIYLVPQSAADDALSLAEFLTAPRAAREHEKAGINEGELKKVGEAIYEALGQGPIGTQALRRALPEGVARSLGSAGKKVGLSSTLPPALRQLEFERRVERRVETGRLDTERYLWVRVEGEPREALDGAAGDGRDQGAMHIRLAELYLRAAGLATRRAFAGWSGLKQAEAKAAFSALESKADAFQVQVAGEKEAHTMLGERRHWIENRFDELQEKASNSVALLSFEDNLLALRGGPAFWVEPEFHSIPVPVWGRGRGSTLGDARQSTLRPILAEGRMVGFWEYDPDAAKTIVIVFDAVADTTRETIEARAEEVGAFLRDDLGHGRSFSLDTDEGLRKRIARLREIG